MASYKFEKGSPEQEAFFEFWNICQKYWIPENSDEYWQAFIEEHKRFFDKFGHNKLARGAMNSLVIYLENKLKEDSTNAET